MYERHAEGRTGENIATRYLQNIGYEVIERNFSCRQGEIDIIAKDHNEIVFVEVKTRSNLLYGKPAEAVTQTKKNHIEKVAQYYLYIKKLEKEYIRIDVIEIYVNKNQYKINHIKQII